MATTFGVVNSHIATQPYNDYGEYYEKVESYINDPYLITKVVEQMVKEYFNRKSEKETKQNKSKDIQKRVDQLGDIKVRVKLD